jgi:hypothetical protein
LTRIWTLLAYPSRYSGDLSRAILGWDGVIAVHGIVAGSDLKDLIGVAAAVRRDDDQHFSAIDRAEKWVRDAEVVKFSVMFARELDSLLACG